MIHDKNNSGPKERVRTVNPRAARLVVRNLPFKVSEGEVQEHFSTFGPVEEVHYLRKNGVFTGCAFVQFGNKRSAGIAIAKTSGRDFKGRPVIVDWAVSKVRYDKLQGGGKEDKKQTESDSESEEEKVEVKEEELSSDDEHPDVEESSSDEEKPAVEELNQSIAGDVKKRRLYSDSESDDSEEENDDVKKEDDGVDDEVQRAWEVSRDTKPIVQPRIKSEKFLEIKRKHQEEDQMNLRTLFVRNVPFSVGNKEFRKAAETAGPVSYALVVMDKMTEHSRGSGFVRYEDAETAEKVLSGEVKLMMNGVEMMVQRARPKDGNAGDRNVDKKAKDNRNLYLSKEGVILAGSPAADGVSEGDMTKRLRLEQWKTAVLRNLHMFISPTRLVVHNIPSHYTDKTLFSLFRKHSPKGAIIPEAKVMKNVNDAAVGRSKGYGFVSYKRHEDALVALRKINNNPDVFNPNRRPIVAFSVENRKALNIKEKRREMSLKNLKKSSDAISSNVQTTATQPETSKKKRKRKSKPGSDEPSNKKLKTTPIPAKVPKFVGESAQVGNKKLRTKRQLLNQAQKHRQDLKKAKKQKKLSRKQKRAKNKKKSIL